MIARTSNVALIGNTGFVGGNLAAHIAVDAGYNSRNIQEIEGKRFDTVYCAGLPAAKWLANKEPEQDRATVATLASHLRKVRARRFVLISTIDVYAEPGSGVNETHDCAAEENHAYGRHRLEFEHFVASQFDNHLILRLPALFGAGLKKNVIFDLMNDNCLEMINPESRFQWYGLDRLPRDIAAASVAGLQVANLMTEPVTTRAISERFFPGKEVGTKPSPGASYDICTAYADIFGGTDRYIQSAAEVLDDIGQYLSSSQAGGAKA